ncbi:MAG: ABC transporter permease [Polyangiaceae bacterium]
MTAWRRALAHPALRALLPLLAVALVGAIFNRDGAFFEWQTHRAMLREISVHGILACGMTVVIITAGIDLSVGSVLALSAVSFALFTMPLGWSAALAVVVTLGVGLSVGAVNGVLVALPRIQAFVVTLASMVFARGLAKQLADGKKVTSSFQVADGSFVSVPQPAIFETIDARVLGDNVSVVTLVFLGCAALTWFILARLEMGRYLYAVGGSAEAARLSGVPVRATLIFAYAFAGVLSAVAGICQAAQETHGDPETGLGYELDAIAMVVLGGTSLMGGRGGIGLTLIGALTLGTLQKVLSLNAFSTEARLMLTGVIIIAAVLFQMVMRSRAREG